MVCVRLELAQSSDCFKVFGLGRLLNRALLSALLGISRLLIVLVPILGMGAGEFRDFPGFSAIFLPFKGTIFCVFLHTFRVFSFP